MPVRTVLVPVTNADASKSVIETAFLVAKAFNSHVDAVHVRIGRKDMVPPLGEDMSVNVIQEMIESAKKESDDRAKKAKSAFMKHCDAHQIKLTNEARMAESVTAGWSEKIGREHDHVAIRGRLSDLIVVGRPVPGSDVPSPATLNAALFETGRAVLVAPPKALSVLGKKIVIFLRGSTEAARAISAGMSFIVRADSVKIITADADLATGAAVEALLTYLAWYGVKAGSEVVSSVGRTRGATLLEACTKAKADLLIMGAYTHSRVRQLILGGVTRRVLDETTIPVLMAH